MSYSPEQIAQACQVPLAAARANWPLLLAALREFDIYTANVSIAVACNVAEETAHTFEPIEEYGNEAYWRGELGDQWWYHGRGFCQRTWLAGYQQSAAGLGLDCVNHPELLLVPVNSARDTALFVKQKPGMLAACAAANWVLVRELWNGGTNGLDVVLGYIDALVKMPYPPDEPPLKGRQFHLVTKTDLLTKPAIGAPKAIDPNHHPVTLPVGTVVVATGGQTPHWTEIHMSTGPIHGWVLTTTLR